MLESNYIAEEIHNAELINLLKELGYVKFSQLQGTTPSDLYQEIKKAHRRLNYESSPPTLEIIQDLCRLVKDSEVLPDLSFLYQETRIAPYSIPLKEEEIRAANIDIKHLPFAEIATENSDYLICTKENIPKHDDLEKSLDQILPARKKEAKQVVHSRKTQQKEQGLEPFPETKNLAELPKAKTLNDTVSASQPSSTQQKTETQDLRESNKNKRYTHKSKNQPLPLQAVQVTATAPSATKKYDSLRDPKNADTLTAAFLTILTVFFFYAAIICSSFLLLYPENKWLLIGFTGFIPSGLLYLLLAYPKKCCVCHQSQFVRKKRMVNKKRAHRFPLLGHLLTMCLHAVIFGWFRCMFCGTSITLFGKGPKK